MAIANYTVEGMKAADFARKLSAVQKRGRKYIAVCPVCGEPSLTFSDGKNGLVLGCYRRAEPGQPDAARAAGLEGPRIFGCDPAAILSVFGLKLNDLLELSPDEAWLRRQLNELSSGE